MYGSVDLDLWWCWNGIGVHVLFLILAGLNHRIPSTVHVVAPTGDNMKGVNKHVMKGLSGYENIQNQVMKLSAVPSGLSDAEAERIILEVLDHTISDRPEDGFALINTLAGSLAAKMAIKSGHKLSQTEQRELINELFACKEPDCSPSQRPTFVTLDAQDLEQKFT